MAPLIFLLVGTGGSRTIGALGVSYVGTWPQALAVGLAAMFIVTGCAHFTPSRREGLISIVPPRLPRRAAIVTATGVLELVGAAGVLVPPTLGPVRVLAASGLTALLIAMFPANIYASQARRSATAPTTPLGPRTVLQLIYVCAAVFVALGS